MEVTNGFVFVEPLGHNPREKEVVHIRSTEKNLPLYHLAFFSRNELGRKFWKEARKYSDDQLDLL